MKTSVVVVVLMACATVYAQIPVGWNYNPFLYYPFTSHQPVPVQETAEVAAARAAHLAAKTSAGGSRSRVVAVQPFPVVLGQPAGSVLDTPEVWAAKVEYYRAHSAAAAANGVVSTLAPLPVVSWGVPQPAQDTPEVAAARAAHLEAHATARGKRSVQQDTPEVMTPPSSITGPTTPPLQPTESWPTCPPDTPTCHSVCPNRSRRLLKWPQLVVLIWQLTLTIPPE